MRECSGCGKVEQPNQRFLPLFFPKGACVCTTSCYLIVARKQLAELGPVDVLEIKYRSEPMTMPRLVALLGVDGWKETKDWAGINQMAWLSKDSGLYLEIEPHIGWELGKFTDSDVDTEWGPVAQGRYRTIDEGEHLHEIMEAIRCAELGTEREVTPMGALAVKAL